MTKQRFYATFSSGVLGKYTGKDELGKMAENVEKRVTDYILNTWDKTVMTTEETDEYIGLPYPFVVPTVGKMFREMYYWDTYFASEGLMLCGREELVKNCTDNMIYMINRFGFMFNGSKFGFRNNSQPPFFSEMVRMVYDKYQDKEWLKTAYEALEKEYEFWQTRRMTPCGLNQYSNNVPYEERKVSYLDIVKRFGLENSDNAGDIAANAATDCESGWDCNPRMSFKQCSCACVDLNSILYVLEKNMVRFSKELENGNEDTWQKRADSRRSLMSKFLFDGNAFYDYNFKEDKTTGYMSVASFYPLWAGAATPEQAKATVETGLAKLEFEYGISTCESRENEFTFQWDYPNGWAPLQFIMVKALDNYGYKTEAVRIAEKYKNTVEHVFDKTRDLWEKYNVTDPDAGAAAEYETPAMMGWTAGIYLWCKEYLKNNK